MFTLHFAILHHASSNAQDRVGLYLMQHIARSYHAVLKHNTHTEMSYEIIANHETTFGLWYVLKSNEKS